MNRNVPPAGPQDQKTDTLDEKRLPMPPRHPSVGPQVTGLPSDRFNEN